MKTVKITSQYGILSRGRHSARRGNGSEAEWAPKDSAGNLVLSPGKWNLHCTDGFSRTARAVATVGEDGNCLITGDSSRFTVLE